VLNATETTLKKAARAAAALFLIGLLTFAGHRLFPVNATTMALLFLLAVLGIATRWGLLEAIVSSVAAMLCFNFFFLPPIGAFTIADPQNLVALIAFLAVSVVASNLSSIARRRAAEATEQRLETEKLFALSRAILLDEGAVEFAGHIVDHLVRVFELPGAILFDRAHNRFFRSGPAPMPALENELREAAVTGTTSSHSNNTITIAGIIRQTAAS